jgi:hypothetical protein
MHEWDMCLNNCSSWLIDVDVVCMIGWCEWLRLALAGYVVFLSVGKSPHNRQTPVTQVTRHDMSLTFLHWHQFMSAHKSMTITIDILLTHFLHWQHMTCQAQQNVAVDWLSTPKSTIMSRHATCRRHIQLSASRSRFCWRISCLALSRRIDLSASLFSFSWFLFSIIAHLRQDLRSLDH